MKNKMNKRTKTNKSTEQKTNTVTNNMKNNTDKMKYDKKVEVLYKNVKWTT